MSIFLQKITSYSKWEYVLGYIFLLSFMCIPQISLANTGINQQIPYSGVIVGNNGVVLQGATRARFLIFDAPVGGVQLYEEIRNGIQSYPVTGVSPSLDVSDGRFEILLGSQNLFDATILNNLNNDTLYLELQLDLDNNGSWEEIFTPRRRLGSTVSAINSLRLVANGGTDTDTLSLDVSGNVIATSLGGVSNGVAPIGYDRVLLANSSGQFSQVNISTLGGGSGWGLLGNGIASSANTIGTAGTGSYLGTTTNQSLQLVTNNLVRLVVTATGDLLTSANVVIGNGDTNASPVGANLRATNASGSNIAGSNLIITGGRGTGTGVGGDLIFATAPAGGAGASLNTAVNRLQITSAGNIITPILGGSANANFGLNDRVLLANSSGQFSQVASSFFSLAGANWLLSGNTLASSSNAIGLAPTGSYLGTPTGNVQSLQLATNGLTRAVITSAGDLLTSANVVIGNGDTNTSPVAANLRATNASGSNIAGSNLTITGGRGTGTGVGGDLIFATAPAGGAGASLNSAVNRLQITSAGNIIAPILGGAANGVAPGGFDRVLLANSSGQFSQVNISTLGGGGGGSPGGSTGQLQFNNAGTFAGASNVQIAQGSLQLLPQTTPTTPASGAILYSESLAGRDLPFYITQSGRKQAVGNAWFGKQTPVQVGIANGTSAPIVLGGSAVTAATLSYQFLPNSTNRYTSMPRKRYNTATANATTGIRQDYTQFYSGNAEGYGGVFFSTRFGVNANKLSSVFVGLTASTVALGGNASALTNMIGMGYDLTDPITGNWFLMANNGAGTAQKIDLLATNAARGTDVGFELNLYNPPNSTDWYVYIVNLNTGAVVLNAFYTGITEVPVVNTGLTWKLEIRNDGVASNANIEHNYIYVEPQGM